MSNRSQSSQRTCCVPPRGSDSTHKSFLSDAPCDVVFDSMEIPGGTGLIGTASPGIPDDGENPPRKTRLATFHMATTATTNAEFGAFVDATGYTTEAEEFGWSFVFHTDVPKEIGPTQGIEGLEWWRRVNGASWRTPNGPGTTDACRPDHPVTQVSWRDANAFARWAGGRLPTEAEWEHAARGGLGDVPFPWGDLAPDETSHFPCNIWQGTFPHLNTAADGWHGTAPARSFEPNGYGLFNTVGNVWEWTSDAYRVRSLKKHVKARLAGMKGFKVSKGGSFLCHKSYCYRYRIAARSGNAPDSAAPHHGFRVVWDV